MMKKILFLALALCTLTSTVYAQKKEKKEKKAKTYEWTWDGTRSGNATVDEYLVTIDTLWNKIQNYSETMDTYEFQTDTLTINGKNYIMAYMITDEGSLVTRATCNWQLINSIGNGLAIGADALKAGTMAASAATALPNLGMKALSYGKYLKGAPNVISLGTKEIKEVVGKQKVNARNWKSLKIGALTEEQVAALNFFDEKAMDNMKRCVYIKEIPDTDPSYEAVSLRQQQKSKEELNAEAEETAKKLSTAIVLPEDASKAADDISDDAFEAELEG